MANDIIETDSVLGKKLGFISTKFDGWLWLIENYVYISMITSLNSGNGNLSKLFDKILEMGYGIKVPTPLGNMILIVNKKGFKKTFEYDSEMGCDCEVWVKNTEPSINK